MSAPIVNAKDTLLNQNNGTVPQVYDAMVNWFQPLTMTSLVKTIVNFQVVEMPTVYNFQGVWQPLSARQLMMKPEGQRSWRWFQLHCQPSVAFNVDDVVNYLGIQYRVKAIFDYTQYGYVLYHLVEDFTGSGP
jgi:hypothetical protein